MKQMLKKTLKNHSSLLLKLAFVAAVSATTAGCVPLVVAGVAGASSSALDRRAISAQITDQGLEMEIGDRIRPISDDVHVNVYGKKILITGTVSNTDKKNQISAAATSIASGASVYNEVRVDFKVGYTRVAKDIGITTAAKASLLAYLGEASQSLIVRTDDSIVYLMGMLTEAEGKKAAEHVSTIKGVTKVVTLWDVLSAEQIAEIEQKKSKLRSMLNRP